MSFFYRVFSTVDSCLPNNWNHRDDIDDEDASIGRNSCQETKARIEGQRDRERERGRKEGRRGERLRDHQRDARKKKQKFKCGTVRRSPFTAAAPTMPRRSTHWPSLMARLVLPCFFFYRVFSCLVGFYRVVLA